MGTKKFSHMLALLIMLIWGTSYLSIKIVVAEIDPTVSAFYRFFAASAVLYVILKIKYPGEKLLKEDRVKMALGGVFGVTLYFFFENYSVLFTSASNVSILISSIPVFTLLSQRIVFKEKMSFSKVSGAVLSFMGIIIIIASKDKVSLFSTGTKGDIMAIAAALCWVVYNVITSKFKGNYKSITITTYQSLWGCLFLAPSLLFAPLKVPSTIVLANLMYLSVFCSIIAYIMYVFCLEHLGATVITTYINLQPIVSLIAARIILSEAVTLWQLAGSIVIIIGVFLVSFGEKIKFNFIEEKLWGKAAEKEVM